MNLNRDALRRFFTGQLPPLLKGQEDAFFKQLVMKNCSGLSLLALLGALTQAAAFLLMKDQPIMRDTFMRWFTILCVVGLLVFGLFFLRQRRGVMPVQALWACQVAFAVYYTVVDLSVLFLSVQMQQGLLRLAPLVLLGALMNMTGGLSAVCFGGYFLGVMLMAVDPVLMVYGGAVAIAGYAVSRLRYGQWMEAFGLQVQRDGVETDKEELSHRLDKMTAWDEQTQMNNRRAMSAWLEAVWPLCVRNRIPVAVLVISPDGIEKIGKEKSPEAVALRLWQFAQALKPFVRRQSDFLGRYDENKFVILYSGLTRPDTDMLIRRIQDQLKEQRWEDSQEAITLCVGGVYALPGFEMVAAQWMTQADNALNRARLQAPGTVLIEEA